MSSHSPRIAVVTGAGSGIGIGAAVAHALAGDGWGVILAGRRQESCDRVTQSSGPGAVSVAASTSRSGLLGARVRFLFLGRGVSGWAQPFLCLLNGGSGLLGQRADQLAGRQPAAQLVGLASPQIDQPGVACGPVRPGAGGRSGG
jgi:NAD(P)-dependent dehydrogenase (short-subunit alcohol dehydrogenase family)